MLNIPNEIKELLKTDSTPKNFRVHFPNGERADITNENLVSESVKFTESVMSQDKFKLGLCESPVIEFEVFNVENIKGKRIECYYEIYCADTVEDAVYRDDLDAYVYPIPLGVFYVDSCKKEAKMNMRQVVAYGEQAYFEWKIPEGTYVKTNGNAIDISAYLALALQTSDVLNITSMQDIQNHFYDTKKYLLCEFSSGLTNALYRNIPETSVFIDFVGTSASETSTTLNVKKIAAVPFNFFMLCITYLSYPNITLFTFDPVGKVKNIDFIKNQFLNALNEYVQEYDFYDNQGRLIENIIHIYNEQLIADPIYYTQPYAYDSSGVPSSVLYRDNKYILYEDFNLPNGYWYIWNNDKTYCATYRDSSTIVSIINFIAGLTPASNYTQALASAINAWETVTGHTWREYGAVVESEWANGENNRVAYGKAIEFTSLGYSINNYESLTREEAQKYAENILESQGKLGRFDREGNFEAFTLDTDTLVPNDTDLVPSGSLTPNGADVDNINPSEYETAWYDDELSLPYGACSATHKVSGTDTYTIVYADGYDEDTDPSTYQIYDISNNDLIKEMTVEEITPILTTIITNLSNLRYMPSDIDMIGRPDIEAGDGIQVMSNSGAFNTYVFSRTIDGIQGLSDQITSK